MADGLWLDEWPDLICKPDALYLTGGTIYVDGHLLGETGEMEIALKMTALDKSDIPTPEALDAALLDMLAFIRGTAPYGWKGMGIYTYPDREDDGKHEACLELERRGLIRRHLDEPGCVVWMPADNE